MLDSQDIELLQTLIVAPLNKRIDRLEERFDQIDERFAQQDKRWEKILDERFAQQDKRWEKILDERIYRSECMLLEEMDRLETRLTKRLDKMQVNLDALNQVYRIDLIERGNYRLLEERVTSLEKRVSAIDSMGH